MVKLTQAVEETRNLILTYNDKPINATFFSTSNGYTENSEEIWLFTVPYLKRSHPVHGISSHLSLKKQRLYPMQMSFVS